MKLFFKRILFFGLAFLFIHIFIYLLWFQYYSFPPPNLSNSISLNAKAQFIKNNFSNKNTDIIAIGSSMSLNNLNSKEIIKFFDSDQFLNVSSWGLKMSDIFEILKIINRKYEPSTIIISSNYMDFYKQNQKINYKALDDYLDSTDPLSNFIKNWDFRRYLEDSRLLFLYKTNETIYKSLKYNKYGGVNFPIKEFNIDKKRWKGKKIKSNSLKKRQYAYLDSISKFTKAKNIRFIFVQSPFRAGYYSKLNNDEIILLNNHINHVESILEQSDAIFINTINRNWNDSLFVDYSHFSKKGSKIFTQSFLSQLNHMNLQH